MSNKIWTINRWTLQFELKLNNFLLFIMLLLPLLFIALVFFYPENPWLKSSYDGEKIYSNIFYFYDLLMPICCVCVLLFTESPCLSKDSCAYINTLPISKLYVTLFRWMRLVLLFILSISISVFFIYPIMNQMINRDFSYIRYLFLLLPNTFTICGLAVFVLVLSKKLFYSLALVGGLILIDASTSGTLFGEFSAMIHLPTAYSTLNITNSNRTGYIIAGVLLFLVSFLIYRSKTYRNYL